PKLLSVPRDTHIELPGFKIKRLNEIFSHHYSDTKNINFACMELKAQLENLFSIGLSSYSNAGTKMSTSTYVLAAQQFTVPFYLQFDYRGFKTLINALGGIRIRITEPMKYEDKHGGLNIDFNPGEYLLNGDDALEYVRYRDQIGDNGRILRQQSFLKELTKQKFANPLILFKAPMILKTFLDNINTNLTFWDILVLGLEIKNMPLNNFHALQLPGRPLTSYWIPDLAELSVLGTILSSPANVTENISSHAPRVEVFNATDRPGFALQVTRFLRQHGVDVLKWGNYGMVNSRTIVFDRIGSVSNYRQAQRVASLLPGSQVVTRIETSPMIDITIILGEDCKELIPRNEELP
ncbi:MAG: LCP family protein, partial [Elusimicrobiota bacterium]